MTPRRLVVELRDVTRSFPGPPEVQALKGVNLTIAAGDYLSIVGPSGSGKSTMLNILGLLDRPSVGEYRLDGVLHRRAQRGRARRACAARRIGFVFQSFHSAAAHGARQRAACDAVQRRAPAEREAAGPRRARRVGLGHRVDFLPDDALGR